MKLQRKSLLLLALAISADVLVGETMGERLELLRGTEVPIVFHGRIVDQYGDAVAKATVSYVIRGYGKVGHARRICGTVMADEKGRFDLNEGKAGLLIIHDIIASGYEFSLGGANGDETIFDYRTSRRRRHRPDREHPVVFHLRKRQAPGTYLLKNSFGISLKVGEGEAYWCGDLANGWSYFSRSAFVSPEAFPDLEATGVLDREQREWRLTIRTNGGQSGIQIRDDLLYEAPADGYARTLDIAFPFTERLRFPIRYLYVRLREPGMYARFRIDNSSESSDQRLYLRCEGVINPYGDRSFEPLSFNADVDFRGFSQCRKEATEAFEKQRLAPRPPFEEWVRDGHARY